MDQSPEGVEKPLWAYAGRWEGFGIPKGFKSRPYGNLNGN
ncbi:hypothetical protein EYZ11_013089 [Aspergillus tanneri]|uniref:Uncharacterized protein n=1 Tax=Aspergillus tanneri TaxID=1220188 RepID=A0A4S3J0N9_9EURO|nr:hypothetical protein EYZ11_013089 [Aspergillus tanneri]